MQLFLGGVFIMKYCQNCGAQLDEKAVVCPKCGVPVAGATMSGVTPPMLNQSHRLVGAF